MLQFLELAEVARRVAPLLPATERDLLVKAITAALQPNVGVPSFSEALRSIQQAESWDEVKLRLSAALGAIGNEARRAGWASALLTLAAELEGACEVDRLQGREPRADRLVEIRRLHRLAEVGPSLVDGKESPNA